MTEESDGAEERVRVFPQLAVRRHDAELTERPEQRAVLRAGVDARANGHPTGTHDGRGAMMARNDSGSSSAAIAWNSPGA